MATTPKQVTSILPVSAPRLPVATVEYSQQYIDQLSNVLRLYFNGVDTTFGSLLGDTRTGTVLRPGGAYLAYPYAAVQRNTDISFTANTATQITFNQNDFLNACANDGTDGIHVDMAGIYNYQFSVQFKNTDTSIHSAWVWLRVNGVDVANTGSKFDVTSSHGGTPGFVIGAANFYVKLQAGQYVEMWAAVDSTAVTFDSTTAQVSPFAMPAIPAVVATLSFVSRLPS
jgi:hypothetical protein